MYYITVMQSPMYHQMTLEEFLFETESRPQLINPNMTNTRTYEVESISDKFLERIVALLFCVLQHAICRVVLPNVRCRP